MSCSAHIRLMKDLKRMEKDPPAGISSSPLNDNLMVWEAVIVGPLDTVFEDGIFKLTLTFSEEYPMTPPLVRFTSKMFHPNIFPDGFVCMNILIHRWSPALDVAAILVSVQSLLGDPSVDSPANEVATFFFKHNKKKYAEMAKECVELSLREQ